MIENISNLIFLSFVIVVSFVVFVSFVVVSFLTMLGLTIKLNHKHCAILLVCRSKVGCTAVDRVGKGVRPTDGTESRPQATLGGSS